MVTGDAGREGVESRKYLVGDGRGFQDTRRQQFSVRTGKCRESPRDRRPRRASHGECTVTKEIRSLAHRECAPSDECKKRGRGRRRSEVGGTHSSCEVW